MNDHGCTKGEWRAIKEPRGSSDRWLVRGCMNNIVCILPMEFCSYPTDDKYDKEVLANAHMLGASKKMYEALERDIKHLCYLREEEVAYSNTSEVEELTVLIDEINAALDLANPERKEKNESTKD